MYVCISFLIWGCFKVWLWLWWRSDKLDVCVSFSRIGLEQRVLLEFLNMEEKKIKIGVCVMEKKVKCGSVVLSLYVLCSFYGFRRHCVLLCSFLVLVHGPAFVFSQGFSAPMGQILDRLQAFGGFEVKVWVVVIVVDKHEAVENCGVQQYICIFILLT